MSESPSHLPNLTVQQLEYLVAAVDHRTHARAAGSLGVSPSALSQGLAELAKRLGVELFDRTGRTMEVRAQAEPIVDHARLVLAHTADLARYVADAKQGRAGLVRLGMIDVAAVHHFASVLHDIRSTMPDIALHLTVAPSSELIAGVRSGSLDLIVGVRPNDDTDLDVVDLVAEPLHVYVASRPVGTFTATPDPAEPETWGPWVGFPTSSQTRQIIASSLEALGADYEVVAESHQPDVLKEMTTLGLGWVVLPPVQAEQEPRRLRRVTDVPLAYRTLSAVQRARSSPNESIGTVREQLILASDID
ncbi:MAG: LysR family transcriptional regulator [Actinobacteria bacterium]|nr:LysR family transcriptional regulator [Actinomycetota bacterium]